ncbi:MAG: transcriptional repressor, partial [Cellulosimicrobium sp.]|nr:transcriptional repressor [Cellulosimicrobium sp.]
IDGPTVEAWANQVGTSHGFVDIQHTIELFGTCAGCARATSAQD